MRIQVLCILTALSSCARGDGPIDGENVAGPVLPAEHFDFSSGSESVHLQPSDGLDRQEVLRFGKRKIIEATFLDLLGDQIDSVGLIQVEDSVLEAEVVVSEVTKSLLAIEFNEAKANSKWTPIVEFSMDFGPPLGELFKVVNLDELVDKGEYPTVIQLEPDEGLFCKGHVKDRLGNPIAGAVVEIIELSSEGEKVKRSAYTTTAGGFWFYEFWGEGERLLRIRASKCLTWEKSVLQSIAELNVEMEESAITFGQVSIDPRVFEGRSVRLEFEQNGEKQIAEIEEDGRFVVSGLIEGDWTTSLIWGGLAFPFPQLVKSPGQSIEFDARDVARVVSLSVSMGSEMAPGETFLRFDNGQELRLNSNPLIMIPLGVMDGAIRSAGYFDQAVDLMLDSQIASLEHAVQVSVDILVPQWLEMEKIVVRLIPYDPLLEHRHIRLQHSGDTYIGAPPFFGKFRVEGGLIRDGIPASLVYFDFIDEVSGIGDFEVNEGGFHGGTVVPDTQWLEKVKEHLFPNE